MTLLANLFRPLARQLLLLMLLVPSSLVAATEVINVGVLAFDDQAALQQRWQPTLDYLNGHLPQYRFVLNAVRPKQLDRLMTDIDIDFMINNGVRTVQYKERYGVSQLLTARPNSGRSPERAIGSSLIVRSTTELSSLDDLRQLRVVSASPMGFGGYMAFKREVIDAGQTPESLFGSLEFVGFPQNSLFDQLRNDLADVAILPSCQLELSLADGTVQENEFKVVLAQPYDDYPCAVSSRLYPYFMLSKLSHVDSELATTVVRLLLDIKPGSSAAVSGRYDGWAIPVDDSEVYGLLKSLRLWPFNVDWLVLTKQLLPYVALIVVILFLGYLHHSRVKQQVASRTIQLRDEISHHKQTQADLIEQRNAFYKAQRVLLTGEMASGLSHELSQPLASIKYLVEGCKYRIDNPNQSQAEVASGLQRINEQTARAQGIINRFKGFCVQPSNLALVDMRQQVSEALALMGPDFNRHQCTANVVDQLETDNWIYGDVVLLQQVLVNLLRNAIDAMENNAQDNKVITLALLKRGRSLVVQLSDSGCGLSQHALERLFMPFETSKEKGLGLGMMICKRIIEQHNGSISAHNLNPGLMIEFCLPLEEQ